MRGDFFTRARILHTVDQYISDARRGSKSFKKESSGDGLNDDFPKGSVFEELLHYGINADVLRKIFSLYETFGFAETPSVGEKIAWYAKSNHPRAYDLLREINLLDHSVRVARNALMEESISREQRGLVSLFCLLHDIGKSKEMCSCYGILCDCHERAGGELIRIILNDTPYERAAELFAEDLNMIANAKEHGDFVDMGFYGIHMHNADKLAREQELKIVKRGNHVEEEIQ